MRVVGRAFAGAVVAALVLAPTSQAAWTDSVRVTGERGVDPRVVVGADGEAFVVWGHRGPSLGEGGLPLSYSTRPPGGGFSEPRPLASNAGIVESVASNSRGDVTVSWFAPPDEPEGSIFNTVTRPAGGEFGAIARPFFRGGHAAMDGDGDTTFVWTELNSQWDPQADDRVLAATRFSDGSVGPVQEVARGKQTTGVSAAADRTGRVVVAWIAHHEGDPRYQYRVEVAEAASPSDPFTAPRVLAGPFPQGVGYPTFVATNDRGDTAVAWPRTTPGADETTQFNSVPEISYRPAGGDFGPVEAVPVERPRQQAMLGWNIAMSEQGDVLLAWGATTGATFALRPAGGAFEPALSIERPGPQLVNHEPRAAFDGNGTAVAAWISQLDYHDHRLVAMMRPRGASEWGPVREIVAARHLFTPRLDFDAAGRGVAVWSHEELRASGEGRTEHGIGAAYFDPTLPDIELAKLARARDAAAVVVDVSKAAGLTVQVQRRAGMRYDRLGSMRARVKRGRNRIRLARKLARRVARPGEYRAVVAVRKRDGTAGVPVRLAFRVGS